MGVHYLNTGQRLCYDERGRVIPCAGTGQDAEHAPGLAWPEPRFTASGDVVEDRLTGLIWTRDANPAEFPMTWGEALDWVRAMNREGAAGHGDWRLPNRRELRSLIDYQTRKPALPPGHPFIKPFLGWYWTGTSSAVHSGYAWYVHLEGGRMFYGAKNQSFLVWPVRGECRLPATGQTGCFDEAGRVIPCAGTGQDGEHVSGLGWPEPRFLVLGDVVEDRLTGLTWTRDANLAPGGASWTRALETVENLGNRGGVAGWRLPTINELESLVDASRHAPALPDGHPFVGVERTYCSSTSSGFEPDWCMVLHFDKGAVGVGRKDSPGYFVWACLG